MFAFRFTSLNIHRSQLQEASGFSKAVGLSFFE
jgi:hypothetical protein